MIDFESIVWPDLNARYLDALKKGTSWILDNFNLFGIIASGTIGKRKERLKNEGIQLSFVNMLL